MTLEFGRGRRDDEAAGRPCAAGGFELWVLQIRPRLVSLARRFLWNHQDAEEVAQDALLLAWRDQEKLRDLGSRNAWVYRTAINLCLSRRRRRQPDPLPATEPAGPVPAGAGGLEAAELMARVRTAISELPPRQQAAVVLRDLEGLPYEQIATIMRSRPASARLLVHRGRETIREILTRRWPESFKS